MKEAAAQTTLFEIDGSIAALTFNRPRARNAMTWEMYDALHAACERVDADPAVRVFVLKGAGGRAFVSGTDIRQFPKFKTRDDALAYEARLDAVFERLERVTKPTIAQVQGAATGGGFLLAMVCDLRVCTHDAVFGVPIARTLGNCLSAANSARVLDLLGPVRFKELLFTGRLIEAEEAAALGLVMRVTEAAAIDDDVRAIAAAITEHAPLTLWAAKETIRRLQAARRLPPGSTDDLVTSCYLSEDFREGVTAFLEKRRPRFTGR